MDKARDLGLEVKAVIAVRSLRQPADYDPIEAFIREHRLVLIADTAQGFGSVYKGRIAARSATSRRRAFSPPSRSAATATAARS